MTAELVSYFLCDSYEAAAEAAAELSSSSTLIVDCEGRDIGGPGGALSTIAVADERASRVFIFDVLALSDKDNTLLAPFLSLLRRSDVTKLMWDGRADFCEIAGSYGVRMEGVLDLQIVEVVQRYRRKRKGGRQDHTIAYFNRMRDMLPADSAELEGIQRLFGLEHCARLYTVIGKGEGKNQDVVAMHGQDRTEMWMQRPLSPDLLNYSAYDIHIIAKLFTRFQDKGTYLQDTEGLKDISARYMEVYPARELRAKHMPLDLCKFVPLDVLICPQDGAPRFKCERCERLLSLPCFSTGAGVKAKPDEADDAAPAETKPEEVTAQDCERATQRLTLCRLCSLLARRNSETVLGEWVDIPAAEGGDCKEV